MDEKPNYGLARILIIISGVGMIIGSFLPWGIVSMGILSNSVYGGDGILISVIGAVVTLCAFGRPKTSWIIAIIFLGCLASGLITLLAIGRVLPQVVDVSSDIRTSFGIGLPLIGVSCLIGMGGASLFGQMTNEEKHQREIERRENLAKYQAYNEQREKESQAKHEAILINEPSDKLDRLSTISASILIASPFLMLLIQSEPVQIGLGLAAVAGLVGLVVANR